MRARRQDLKWRWRNSWVLVWLLVVACVNLVPRQGWDPASGPVVPHDSFPADCSLCHHGDSWHELREDFTFDHLARTGVALEGAHRRASCLLCHNDRGPVQQYAARGCGGCHGDPHLTRLGAHCDDCHDQRTWYPREAIVLHDATRFPLVGAHAAAACFRCHPGAQVGNFAGASSVCSDCHQADYARTMNPDHASVGFSQACDECHRSTGWQPAAFAHPASFPLSQGHAGRACAECHTTPNVFTGLSTDCFSCHDDDFVATTEPSHNAAGFSMQCDDCHGTATFLSANWPHPGSFELTFGHAGRRCSECHVGQMFAGTQSDCASCHLDTYQATQNPNHATAGFGTDCAGCHGTATWQGGAVEHPASFPLENAHQQACTACHQTGVYQGLDPACAACHLPEYQAAMQPPHASFQMSQQCQDCHTTISWGGGNWQHDFPIQSGAHSPFQCFDCHNNPGNRVMFSCTHCHDHRESEMADEHSEVQGYVWSTANCHACHPNGDH